jgi:flagellar motor switch protein FliN/FliY
MSESSSRDAERLFELAQLDAESKLATTLPISSAHQRRELRIELGRAEMYADDARGLTKGAVVALDKLIGDPVDIYAAGRLVARGEVLVVEGNFGVRILELIAADSAVGSHTTRLAAAG